MDHDGNCKGWLGKVSIVLGVGLLGFGAIFYGAGVGTQTSTKPAALPLDRRAQKPVRAMNMALGPMVFLARELDFTVKNARGDKLDNSRIATRVENQLLGLRDLYRQEIAKNPKLVGSLISQLTISPAGEVIQLKEVSGRINDGEFKRTVAAEIAKWTFPTLIAEAVTVQCPLLFVQEGMDITTLVHWESLLTGAAQKKLIATVTNAESIQPAKLNTPTAPPTAIAKAAAVKTAGQEVRIKHATLLRKEPNFSALVLATFTVGTKLIVINRSGDWLEVKSHHSGPSGYIRKEFVIPVEVAVYR
jgi:Bacterial SH3 domain